ncbi:YEATS domain-containing protein 4 [Orchesella cincta]|uniref:YEATS domain-containing protein 4 n=1 Tax=Orchesella cincta TaxID=48709 RepID=A0A1D2N990_ORCCI|nr:YEATS domain-containing protein 4 [Orchesella cincta]
MTSTPTSTSVAHDYGPDSGGRLKGVKVVKPIVVGNTARYFGKKREEDGHTHQWTVFLRPYLNEDYSAFIKKVHFKLHDSYPNPSRIVTKPPFDITETGWGEFEIVIKIYFVDTVERPVTLYHILKLFETSKDPTAPPIVKKYICSETYDEIVFMEPTKLMMDILQGMKPIKPTWKPESDIEGKKQAAKQSITHAKSIVKSEIEELRNKLKISRSTIEDFKKKLMEAQQQPEEEMKSEAVMPETSLSTSTETTATPTPLMPTMPITTNTENEATSSSIETTAVITTTTD